MNGSAPHTSPAIPGEGRLAAIVDRSCGDLHSPVSVFLRLAGCGPAFLLESAQGEMESGRYSFIGFDPVVLLSCRREGHTLTWSDGRVEHLPAGDPVASLASLVERFRIDPASLTSPFRGGAVGYISYEAAAHWERLPLPGGCFDDQVPVAGFMIPGTIVAFDRLTGVMTTTRFVPATDAGLREGRAELARLRDLLTASAAPPTIPTDPENGGAMAWSDSLTREAFESAVKRVLDDIRNGEILQAVLSLRRSAPTTVDPFTVYRYLRTLNPSPYLFFLRFPEVSIAGSSPEMMVRLQGDLMTLKPIAGTRPRGESPREDDLLVKELLASEKDRAEHAMLVDLGRNDLGRVASPGSVRVEKTMEVESFSHVHHLVSRVTGRLRPGGAVADLVRSTFPAGTVSGAPKIRAMEIIAREEQEPRGPYAGLVGYLGFDGNFDSAIVIRSAVFTGGSVRVQAGAGIVADSDPESEYREIMAKAGVVMEAIRRAKGAEQSC